MPLRISAVHRFNLSTFVLVLAFILVGCEEPSAVPTDEEEVDPNLPPAQVDLPPPPPASAFEIREQNEDGSLRVEGLIAHREKYLDQPVELRGTVTFISEACDPRKAKRQGKECERPSMIVKDDQDALKEMYVVGHADDYIKRAKLKVGESRLFKGTYKLGAQGFVASEDGLLDLVAVDEIPVREENPKK